MAAFELDWWCLETPLPGGLLRLDALGFPELGAVGSTRKSALSQLERRLQALGDGEFDLHWHRRQALGEVHMGTLALELAPPTRQLDWVVPLVLPVHYAHWRESAQRHLAWVPTLAVATLVARPEQLEPVLRAELKLLLAQRKQRPRLRELAAQWSALGPPELSQVRTTLKLVAPRERLRREARQGVAETTWPTLRAAASTLPAGTGVRTLVAEATLALFVEALTGTAGHSVLLVGPEGCGKSTLWQQLVHRQAALGLKEWSCWQTSGSRLVAGQSGYGMWQERCRDLCRELLSGKHLLHLGNLRELLEVGRTRSGEQSIGEFLRGEIARGGVRVVAESTPEELAKIEREWPAMAAAFQLVHVESPSASVQRELLQAEFDAAPGEPVALEAAGPALELLHRLHLRYAGYSARPARALRFLRGRLAEHFPQRTLDSTQVLAAFSRQTGLPRQLLDPATPFDPDQVAQWFEARVIGQPQAIAAVVERLLAIRTGLVRTGRPLASLLLIGPTGTGKTELAKTLAAFVFGDAGRLTRFDLSEVTDAAAVARLIGGPGAGAAEGLLTAKVREQPFSVLLFDEFEKADPAFFDLLLQMLGDARLTDGAGRVADFSNTLLVLTSNLGAASFQRGRSGFTASSGDPAAHFEHAVQSFVRPELYNRFDAIVPFLPLQGASVQRIAARVLDQLAQRPGLAYGRAPVVLEPGLAAWLGARGSDATLGARPLKRALERDLVSPLAAALNRPVVPPPTRWRVSVDAAEALQVRAEWSVSKHEVEPGSPPPAELARRASERRRLLDQLENCRRAQELRDECALLRQRAARRMPKARRPRAEAAAASAMSPQEQARLRLLEQLDAEFSRLRGRFEAAEDAALLRLWAPDASASTPAADTIDAVALDQAVTALRRQLARAGWAQPDRIMLQVYCEHPAWLRALIASYEVLAREVLLIQVLPRPAATARTGATPPAGAWTPVADRKALERFPDGQLLGVQLTLAGESIAPLLALEAGVHVWKPAKDQGGERHALVEVQPTPSPPAAVALRSGGIASSGLPRRRTFHHAKLELVDALLDPPRQPWALEAPQTLIPGLARLALDRQLARLHLDGD